MTIAFSYAEIMQMLKDHIVEVMGPVTFEDEGHYGRDWNDDDALDNSALLWIKIEDVI